MLGRSPLRTSLKITALLLSATFLAVPAGATIGAAAEGDPAAALFERRIMPIFKSPNPSSCTQCHLAGVELKNYILPSSEKTFLSLRDQELIDLVEPANSKILKLINMRDAQNGDGGQSGANLIHEKTRQAEYEAFAEWIKACAADATLVGLPKLKDAERALPKRPPEVIRHARKDALLESFENNIWAMRFRCMSCHIEGTPENAKLVGEYGERVAWMKKGGAEATMNYLIGSKLVDIRRPENSLLLLKPLKAVEHGGGKKFILGDQGYQAFRFWLDDYAKTVGDKYATAAALPKTAGQPVAFGTNHWLKLSNTPPAWGDALVRAEVHAWNAATATWEADPIATTDRQNSAKGRIWQHTLTLMAPPGSETAKRWKTGKPGLPAGRYLVRVYVPRVAQPLAAKQIADKPPADWRARPGAGEFVGQAEFNGNWGEGYGKMTVVDAGMLRTDGKPAR